MTLLNVCPATLEVIVPAATVVRAPTNATSRSLSAGVNEFDVYVLAFAVLVVLSAWVTVAIYGVKSRVQMPVADQTMLNVPATVETSPPKLIRNNNWSVVSAPTFV